MHHRSLLTTLLLTFVATACGGDDSSTATTSAQQTTQATASSEAVPAAEAPAVATAPPDDTPAGVAGTVLMTVGDTTIEAQVVQCTIAEPDVAFVAQGETAQIQVSSSGDYAAGVVVSGAFEFEGQGTAAFNPDTSGIDQGDIMVTGQGALPDDASPIENFTVDARGLSC